jgi:ABC-type dipeptide/oligopeptide/nickel transport system permease component
VLRYALVRIASVIPVLLGVSVAVFFMVRLVPGDPTDMMFPRSVRPTPEQREAMRHRMGLDEPIYLQYVRFLTRAVQGDLGTSYRTQKPVTQQIMQRLPNTLKLTGAGLLIAMCVGIPAGVLAAMFRDRWIDRVSMLVAVVGVSVPGFWLSLLLMLVFSVWLSWFPVAGAETWKHVVLPALTLGLIASAILARVTRASMLDVLSQDYVRTARAKGLSEFRVICRHTLRNALAPVLTISGLVVGSLLSGAFLIEAVFGYPGIGLLSVDALLARDFPIIQGIVLFVGVVYVMTNVLVDLLYSLIDPRIGYSN